VLPAHTAAPAAAASASRNTNRARSSTVITSALDAELEEHRVGETDAGAIGQRHLDAVLALAAVHLVEAAWHRTAVHRGAEAAEIDQAEAAALGVVADPRVLVRPGVVLVRQPRERARRLRRRRRWQLRRWRFLDGDGSRRRRRQHGCG